MYIVEAANVYPQGVQATASLSLRLNILDSPPQTPKDNLVHLPPQLRQSSMSLQLHIYCMNDIVSWFNLQKRGDMPTGENSSESSCV